MVLLPAEILFVYEFHLRNFFTCDTLLKPHTTGSGRACYTRYLYLSLNLDLEIWVTLNLIVLNQMSKIRSKL